MNARLIFLGTACLAAGASASPATPARPDRAGRDQAGPAARPIPRNEALRRTLVQMGEEDQAEIQRAFAGEHVPPTGRLQRQALLRQILAEFGWPGIRLVGEDGASGAWIVVQHADDDVAFQRWCLTQLEAAYRQGEARGSHLAYLTDRVLGNEGKPQLYGTQGGPVYTPAERARVDARRKKLGLPSLAETARRRGRLYEQVYREAARSKPAP
jgi:hypothetical protein